MRCKVFHKNFRYNCRNNKYEPSRTVGSASHPSRDYSGLRPLTSGRFRGSLALISFAPTDRQHSLTSQALSWMDALSRLQGVPTDNPPDQIIMISVPPHLTTREDDEMIILTAFFCILNNDAMYLSHVLPTLPYNTKYGSKKNCYTELVKLMI